MDLAIAGKWAIVCASSQGLGRACAQALAAEGVNVVVNGRDAACAFLCSMQASYISGVNRHLDGGSYPGLV
jgi:NADP-dependent 3-hydroxy acid dehydrogenase YdfG